MTQRPTPHGKLMITILGGLAEFERSLILARTSEGPYFTKARSVAFGRKPKLTRHQRAEALARRAAGEPWRKSAKLQRQSQHDQSACGGVAPSELADGSSAPANSNPIQRRSLGGTGDVG